MHTCAHTSTSNNHDIAMIATVSRTWRLRPWAGRRGWRGLRGSLPEHPPHPKKTN